MSPGQATCRRNNSYSPVNSSPFFLQVMSGGGFPLTEHLMWTSVPITVSWSWGGSISHIGGSARWRVRTTHTLWEDNKRTRTEVHDSQRTFHDHVEVVNCFSGCVLGFTHVLSSIALLCVRQEQKLPKVVKFCPRGQLLPHFHPFYFWNGATMRNTVICVIGQTTQQFWGWRSRAYTYYPSGIHSSCRSSPFNTTFSVWTPGGSSMLGILIGGGLGAGKTIIITISERGAEANTAWNTPTCFSLRPSTG